MSKIIEYIKDTKEPVTDSYIASASRQVGRFIKNKGIKWSITVSAITALLYKLSQNKFITDTVKYMLKGTRDVLVTLTNGTIKTGKFMRDATIHGINMLTGVFSKRAKKRREAEDIAGAYALQMKIKLQTMINQYGEYNGFLLRNMDYLIYHNDWAGVIKLCDDEYHNSKKELRVCIANVYKFSHEAKLVCQDTDLYRQMVKPEIINFMNHYKFDKIEDMEEAYGINLKNVIWSKPDDNLYFNKMGKHFNISPELLETRFIEGENFKPIYELISPNVAYNNSLIDPHEYRIRSDPRGVIKELEDELKALQSEKEASEQKQKQKQKQEEEQVVEQVEQVVEEQVEEQAEEQEPLFIEHVVKEEEEGELTLEEAIEEYNNNRHSIDMSPTMLPSQHYNYYLDRCMNDIPSNQPLNQITNNLNSLPSLNQTSFNSNMGLNDPAGIIGVITSILVAIGYLRMRNDDTDDADPILPTRRVNNPEHFEPAEDEEARTERIDIEQNPQTKSKSFLDSIRDYFWPKED